VTSSFSYVIEPLPWIHISDVMIYLCNCSVAPGIHISDADTSITSVPPSYTTEVSSSKETHYRKKKESTTEPPHNSAHGGGGGAGGSMHNNAGLSSMVRFGSSSMGNLNSMDAHTDYDRQHGGGGGGGAGGNNVTDIIEILCLLTLQSYNRIV